MNICHTKYISAAGLITSGAALLVSMHIGMDGTNDPSITVYNGTSTSGTEVVPTNSYDADKLGLNGFEATWAKNCPDGIYVDLTCSGTVEIVIGYIPM